jgi:hypothetical protein
MWMLYWLPDSVLLYFVYGTMGLGVSLILLSLLFQLLINPILRWFPVLAAYYKLVQIAKSLVFLLGVVLLILGVYFYGGYETEQVWRERVKEAEAKIKIAEEKAPVITKEVVTKYKDKILIVKHGVEVIKKEIEVKREIINEGCKLNPTAVEIYNKGVTGTPEENK